jgi:hypothetical protein
VRFVHPLFASAILASADLGLRRDGHRRLAAVIGEGEQAAQHLALAAAGPDREVARALEAAAATAANRGAPVAAAELLEQAVGLTPATDSEDAQRRLADAARAWFIASDGQQAMTLLKEALAKAPAGPMRARVRAELATVEAEVVGSGHAVATYRQALMEAEGDATLQADISQRLTVVLRFTEGTPEFLHALGAAVVAFAERSGDPPPQVLRARYLALRVSLLRHGAAWKHRKAAEQLLKGCQAEGLLNPEQRVQPRVGLGIAFQLPQRLLAHARQLGQASDGHALFFTKRSYPLT